MGRRPGLLLSRDLRAASNSRATSSAAAEADSNAGAVVFNGAAVPGFSVAEAINAPAPGVAAVSAVAVERVAAEAGVAEDDALDSRPGTTMSSSLTVRTLLVLVGVVLNADFSTHCWQLTRAAIAAPAPIKQQSFATPDEALKAVVEDLKANNQADLLKIFGPGIEPILNSGDPVADQNARERFVAAAEENHHFDGTGDTLTLVVGKDDWPFPIPLKKMNERW